MVLEKSLGKLSMREGRQNFYQDNTVNTDNTVSNYVVKVLGLESMGGSANMNMAAHRGLSGRKRKGGEPTDDLRISRIKLELGINSD